MLRAALQDAVDEELLSRNVARLVQLRVTDDRRVRSFSRAEALRFPQAAEQHRLYALWAVALAMGLRRGEALGLTWADVDLDGARLTVRQALHRVDGQLRLDPVKTDASVAVLPNPAPLVNILRAHRKRQLEERFAAGSRWREKGLVFTTSHGGFVEPRNAHRMFHDLCKRADVPQLASTTSPLVRHAALYDGRAASDRATDSAPQLHHRDHRHSCRGDRGRPTRRAGFDGQLVRCRARRERVHIADCRQSAKLEASEPSCLVELTRTYSNLGQLCRKWAELRKRIDQSPPLPPLSARDARKTRSKRFLTARNIADITRRYEAGETTRQIGNCYGISKMRVATVLRQEGITLRRQGLNDEQVNEAAALYAAGKSLAWLGARFGVSHTTIAIALRQQGIQLRPRPGWR